MPGKVIPKPDARLALAQLALSLHQVAVYGLGIRKQRGGCAVHTGKPMFTQEKKTGRIGGLSLPLTGQRVGLGLPLAKRSAEKRAPCVLEALAISTGTAKTKASYQLAFG